MKQFVFLLLSVLVLSACHHEAGNNSQFFIKGNLSNTHGEKVLLSELTTHGFIPLDSAKISPAGEFYFHYHPVEKSIYTLQMGKDAIQVILDKGDTVLVSGDMNDLSKTLKTEGSADTKLLELLRHHTNENFDKVNALLDYNDKSQDLPDYPGIKDSIDRKLHQIFLDQQQFVKKQIKQNAGNFGALFAYYIYQKFGRLDLFSEDEKLRYSLMLDSLLLPKYPKNSHILDHHSRVTAMKRKQMSIKLAEENLQTGKIMPDIELDDTAGNTVKLSSLRGKVVLVTFWSAVCGKCRVDNLKLVKIYKKYHPEGFDIYSVFIGPDKKLWEAAIKIDQIKWIQVSDLNPQSSVKELFHLPDDIYRTFLIDKKGVIIAQNPDVETLETRLKPLLALP